MMGEVAQCFQNTSQGFQIYEAIEDLMPPSGGPGVSSCSDVDAQNLLYNLSLLREKVQQMQSLVGLVVSPEAALQPASMSVALSTAGSLVQDIIVAASSLMYTFQQAAAVGGPAPLSTAGIDDENVFPNHHVEASSKQASQHVLTGETPYNSKISVSNSVIDMDSGRSSKENGERRQPPASPAPSSLTCDIIELGAADLLAKYTHYCQICGKGFKRDANLRMHMRAHGDEYKSNAALANPMKSGGAAHVGEAEPPTKMKYSCPHEGCRWNKNHAKFQPLKSMICMKNHYKRSHCPKMYVCKRCNRKQFSVLSDLRTHEKHCGDIKWLCSCGTTFSRKDKLLGHVALFAGHKPAGDCFAKQGSSTGVQRKGSGIQIDGSCY